jgi:excisionase family DNA binding protein
MAANLQSSKPKPPQLLKAEEVAKILNLKTRTIYDMVQQQRIPFRRPLGSTILRFDLDEIVAWTRGENNGGENDK